MKTKQLPKVAVLLAAYNGEKYIQEQIESIVNQVDVDVYIYISIDASTDRTLEICKNLQKKYNNISIINEGKQRFGSAGQNFYHLIENIDFENFDFISFSDQDDVWLEKKLINGCNKLLVENKDCYSSNVIAFWENGKIKNIIKSQPQKKYDYFFEAAGPGCTYIIKKETAQEFKKFIKEKKELLSSIKLHDWLIYSWARCNKKSWYIDEYFSMKYRQHTHNQVGANHGISSIKKRFKQVISRQWINQCKSIYNATKTESIDFLESINSNERKFFLHIIFSKNNFRRKLIDFIFLKIIFIYLVVFKK